MKLVIDTTPEFRLQILREKIGRLDAVIFTHSHADHIMGLDDCRRFCDLRGGTGLPIYATQRRWRICGGFFSYAFIDRADVPRAISFPNRTLSTARLRLGDLEIVPLALPHGRAGTNGYLFLQDGKKRLAYLSDCKEVPPAAVEAVRGVEGAVLDALRRAPHPTHMCLDEALTAARRIGAAKTYFHPFDPRLRS